MYVPATDTYKFRFQFCGGVPASDVTFSLDGAAQTLSTAENVYGNGVTSAHGAALPGTPTDAGYTQARPDQRGRARASLTGGTYHQVTITFDNATGGPASFRFAYSRANGDIADAAAAAKGKKLAVVFLNDFNASTTIPNPYGSQPGDDLGARDAERRQHPAHPGGGRREPEHGGRAEHHQPGADAVDQRRQVGPGDVVLR